MAELTCFYCGKNPGAKKTNPTLWDGFLDKDTDQLVCWDWECYTKHYVNKSETEFAGMFSEFPVPIKPLGRNVTRQPA